FYEWWFSLNIFLTHIRQVYDKLMRDSKKFVESMIFPLFLFTVMVILYSLWCVISTVDVAAKITPILERKTNITALLYAEGNYLHKLGNYTTAIKYFDKALAIDPNYVSALNDKGLALGYLGNYTGAIMYFDKALAIDPNYVPALNGKGLVLGYVLG